jgi:hypothetical protein
VQAAQATPRSSGGISHAGPEPPVPAPLSDALRALPGGSSALAGLAYLLSAQRFSEPWTTR